MGHLIIGLLLLVVAVFAVYKLIPSKSDQKIAKAKSTLEDIQAENKVLDIEDEVADATAELEARKEVR